MTGKKRTLKFYRVPFFPMSKKPTKDFAYRSYVGIGGNEGDTIKIFQKVVRRWQNDRRLRVVATSPILKNPPFGYIHQSDFFNAIILLETSMSPMEFLKVLLHVEKRFGRVRSFKNAPRTLDLDIILFHLFERNSPKLMLPHPRWTERVSVLAPFAMMEK